MFDVFRLFTEEEELTSSLFLKSVRPSDSGYYSCKAGSSQAVIFLTVIGRTIRYKKLRKKFMMINLLFFTFTIYM